MNFLRILSILLIIGPVSSRIRAQHFPQDADELYRDFSASIQNNNLQDFEKVMCKATLVRMKNQTISGGQKFPDDFFESMQMALISQKDLKYIKYKKNGPTTNVYYKYVPDGKFSAIITLGLVEEEGTLKIGEIGFRDASDFEMDYKANDYSYLDHEEFQPTGKIPEVPKAVEKVDYLGDLMISAYGYKVSVTINGFFQMEVKNSQRNGIVTGGVNKGENTINVIVEKINPEEKELPFIMVNAIINDDGVNVFLLNEEISGTITKTFTVN